MLLLRGKKKDDAANILQGTKDRAGDELHADQFAGGEYIAEDQP